MTPMEQPLDLHWERELMDQIDSLLLSFLRRRIEHSQRLQHRKASAGLTVHDPDRERVILARYDRNIPGGGAIARAILDCCRFRYRPGVAAPAQPPTSKDPQMDPPGGCPT